MKKAILRIKLPESCMECQLRNWEYRLQAHLCKAIKPFPHNIVDNYITGGRPQFCPLEIESETGCEYCDKKDNGFKPINDTMRYSGIEIAMSPLGVLRVRHYPISDYDCGFDTQDVVNINVCPKCGRDLREEK